MEGMSTSHTPPPWSLAMANEGIDGPLVDTPEIVTGTGRPRYVACAETVEDARFIVLACDHHAEAIRTLERFVVALDEHDFALWPSSLDGSTLKEAYSLIARMRGEA